MSNTDAKSKILDFSRLVDTPRLCPRCNEMMQGPYTKYSRRESELYFDLERKYEHCSYCGDEVEIIDLEVLIDMISRGLPPREAREFSMESSMLYEAIPEKAVSLLYSKLDALLDDPEIPRVNRLHLDSSPKKESA